MASVIDEEAVARLAQLAGIEIGPERRGAVAAMLRDMVGFMQELETLDLTGVEPAAIYDPSWTKPGQEDAADG